MARDLSREEFEEAGGGGGRGGAGAAGDGDKDDDASGAPAPPEMGGAAPRRTLTEELERRIVETARRRFREAEAAERENRARAMRHVRFARAGEQWPEEIAAERKTRGKERPMLTINLLEELIFQIVNDQRQNRPAVKVVPVDDVADPKMARVLQGLIRAIEYHSNADTAYDTAHEHAVDGGFGFWRIVTEYEPGPAPRGGKRRQRIRILRIPNRLTVLLDPRAEQADYSDATHGFVLTKIPEEEYREAWPAAAASPWEALGEEDKRLWREGKDVLIVEYFWIEESGADGEPECWWAKLNGREILRRPDGTPEWRRFPSRWVPILKVVGAEIDIEGRRHTHGIVHNAEDAQREFNYLKTKVAEVQGLAPLAPFRATPKQIDGFKDMWENANRIPYGVLLYNPDPSQGAGDIQRMQFTADTAALQADARGALEDVERTTGMYAASRGAPGNNEKSGRAIFQEQKKGDVAAFHFADNLARAIRHAGRIMVDMIPAVYGGAAGARRVVRIVGDDGSDELVTFGENLDGGAVVTVRVPGPLKKGAKVPDLPWPLDADLAAGETRTYTIYDVSVGAYDVRTAAGPSYTTKRQENAQAMMEMLPNAGAAAPALLYLAARNMEWEGAEAFGDAMLAMLPPEVAEVLGSEGGADGGGAGDDAKGKLREAQAALAAAQEQGAAAGAQAQQAMAMAQQLGERLRAALAALKDKSADQQVKIAVAQINAAWQRFEAEQATLRVALEKGAETAAARRGTAPEGMPERQAILHGGAAPGQEAGTPPAPPAMGMGATT